MKMPFGKYRGCALDDLPFEYLQWLLTRDLREPLYSEIQAAVKRFQTLTRQLGARALRLRKPLS